MFFFFKQKTAYEMRISDWSSDVCSSDLVKPRCRAHTAAAWQPSAGATGRTCWRPRRHHASRRLLESDVGSMTFLSRGVRAPGASRATVRYGLEIYAERSEEHTSELQSLMRISYAVFCFKKT